MIDAERSDIGRSDIEIDRSDPDRPEVDRSDIDRSDVGRSDIDLSDVGRTDVDRSDVDRPDVGRLNTVRFDIRLKRKRGRERTGPRVLSAFSASLPCTWCLRRTSTNSGRNQYSRI